MISLLRGSLKKKEFEPFSLQKHEEVLKSRTYSEQLNNHSRCVHDRHPFFSLLLHLPSRTGSLNLGVESAVRRPSEKRGNCCLIGLIVKYTALSDGEFQPCYGERHEVVLPSHVTSILVVKFCLFHNCCKAERDPEQLASIYSNNCKCEQLSKWKTIHMTIWAVPYGTAHTALLIIAERRAWKRSFIAQEEEEGWWLSELALFFFARFSDGLFWEEEATINKRHSCDSD